MTITGTCELIGIEGWQAPGGGFWEGCWQASSDLLEVRDPETDLLVGVVADAGAAEVNRAVDYLARHLHDQPWPLWQRRETLVRASERVALQADLFAHLISAEGCKTITEARREVDRAVETLRLSAEAASALEGRTVPFENSERGTGWLGWYSREPVGVVGAITPFNDPLNLVAHKLGPALIGGNAVLLKPSEATPLTAMALVELLLACGVPGNRLAVLTGHQSGPALVAHPQVDVISFTGGAATADRIASGGPARKLLMELGGNNALIACADASPEEVAAAIVDGGFGVAGQNCLSVQRVFVAADRYPEVVERVVAKTAALRVGSKSEPDTEIGPMITREAATRVERWIDEAIVDGARLLVGGQRDGAYLIPAVLTDVPHSTRLWREEVFGPVVTLEPFDQLDDALAAANAVDTGLQAGVFTQDLDRALEIAARLRVGAVMINSSSDFRIDAMPFGGFKRSAVGREGIQSGVESLTEPKVVAIRTARGRAVS